MNDNPFAGMCRHYNGRGFFGPNGRCRAGVRFGDLLALPEVREPSRLPCLPGNCGNGECRRRDELKPSEAEALADADAAGRKRYAAHAGPLAAKLAALAKSYTQGAFRAECPVCFGVLRGEFADGLATFARCDARGCIDYAQGLGCR